MPVRLLLVLGLAGCAASADQTAPPEIEVPVDAAARVEIAVLGATSATIDLELPGEVIGSKDAMLASALGGYVERVSVEPGQAVSKGTHITSIDAEVYAAGFDQAKAQHALAASDLGRVEKLGDLASAQQLEQATTQVAMARASERQARARLARARITAPFKGIVADVFVDAGEVAGPGTPVARLVQLDPVTVVLSVPDRDVVSLSKGMGVRVTSAARSTLYEGVITHVAPAADVRTRAFPVEVEVANPEHTLLPGMIATVSVSNDVEAGTIIPQEWIITRRDGHGVFVDVDNVAVWTPIELGAVVHDQIVVDSGLEEGDRIIMRGHRELLADDAILVAREGRCCTQGRAAFGDD
jgi:membrane fusion protein (multidrug efflux system)